MNSGDRTEAIKKDIALFVEMAETFLEDEANSPVAPYVDSSELMDRLDLSLPEDATLPHDYRQALSAVLEATPKTASTMFFNQLFGGRHGKAMLGDLLAVLMNNSMYTYKAGGPHIQIEILLITEICKMLGWDENSSGTFAPGGSMTNLKGLIMARDVKSPSILTEGVKGVMCLYTSEASHYSVQKNAAFAGVGRDQVRKVMTDERGRMKSSHLKKLVLQDIKEGHIPFMVNATAGTTVLGAFDPLEEIAEICEEHGLWFHVDGAYCGSVIFSDQYHHLVKGANRADSFTLNAHKMLGTPLSCSLIMVKNKEHLYQSFSNDANYLYQTHDDDMNPGKISLQCGRRNDAFKFWTLWKSIGRRGLETMVDHQFELADYARDYINGNDDYVLYSFEDSISICFNYRGISPEELCTRLYEKSEIMVGFGSFREDTFIRLVTVNSGNSKEDIQSFFEHFEAFAKKEFQQVSA